MAVDPAGLTELTDWQLGTDFTQAKFDGAKARAERRFAREDPGLPAGDAADALLYLIAHEVTLTKTGGGKFKKWSVGDSSFERSTEAGETPWLRAYAELIGITSRDYSACGVTRRDRTVRGGYRLSANDLLGVNDDD